MSDWTVVFLMGAALVALKIGVYINEKGKYRPHSPPSKRNRSGPTQ